MTVPAAPEALAEGPVLLDASFLIALLEGDQVATSYAGVLPRAVVSALTLAEVYATVHERTGIEAATLESGLRALGTQLVDFPVAAAAHLPALRAIDAASRTQHEADGDEAAALSWGELAVLAHAMTAGLPVLTGDRSWTALTGHGLSVDVRLVGEESATA